MKYFKHIFLYLSVFAMLSACGDVDEVLPFTQSTTPITFPGNPSFTSSVTSLDRVDLDVAVANFTGTVTVTGEGFTTQTFNVASGTGTLSATLAELGYPWGEKNDESSVELAFDIGGEKRLYTVSVTNPISIDDDKVSTEVTLDSMFSVCFLGSTKAATIDNYEIFFKKGANGTYPTVANSSNTIGATEQDSTCVDWTAMDANYDIGDTIYYKVVFNSGTLSDSVISTVIVTPTALTEAGTITLTTQNVDDTNNAFNFSTLGLVSDATLATHPDSADIRLNVSLNGGGLNISLLELNSGSSGTLFTMAPSSFTLASATYESVRDGYATASGTVGTTTNLSPETLDANQVVFVRIGNIPNGGSAVNDSRRYAAIQITNITKNNGGVDSEITFDYKAPKQ